ncbi:ASKHA domain-containing protein [Syntrophotalea acetylenica]|uniref:Ferredoxin n=1 Tax=Syntrophotalea acetylenica TaxID=29542 RepID=A0A1L3GCU2_SYNAC|nr:ASKHA domain-containing protein [Syntrophotalea acetylenica]APG23756.1 ferredoxin [Syntrophotalea acetylenica]APG44337.1 ferredoxin [Syntrophotalea acetylenica]MDY0263233.1 ASKHA domain-containing protein [Syntrophotalea acetylenica]
MFTVRFLPGLQSVAVAPGTTILEAARRAGVMLESPCNGVGTCGKCTVRLDVESLWQVNIRGARPAPHGAAGPVEILSCQAEVHGDVTVEIPTGEQHDTLQVLSHGEAGAIELAPCIRKVYLEEKQATSVFAGERLLATEAGDTRPHHAGMVVDIGTTTLVAALVDLTSGREIATAAALNPQSRQAQDVLSRIHFASEETGLQTMHADLVEEINRLTADLSRQSGLDSRHIYEIVYSGNTCMLHLATGTSPASLGRYPYTPLLRGSQHVTAAGQGLHIADSGLIYLPPVISGYVGADLTSGIVATGLHRREGTTLLVDIGTNGEMILARNGELRATSTAAGPAFEGMNISCGMRASRGAVEYFAVDGDGSLTIRTIGNARATGLCGSGLLDIVGELVAHGVIGGNGRFLAPDRAPHLPVSLLERLVPREGKTAFQVTEDVFLSQKDIRQVQLAKGAIRAGIEFLLQNSGIAAVQVDRVLIAGSFGYHLQEQSLLNLGLLPREFAGRVDFVGNTSKTGGQALLLNQNLRNEMTALVSAVEVIELANFPDFDRVFVKCLGF